jgi:hypothetical protein
MPEDLKKLEEVCRDIGKTIGTAIDNNFGPFKVGFALMVFDFGEGGHMTYVSNGQRQEMVRALQELLDHIKKGG